jgi:osmotically-inducible protein OsmY
MSIEGTVPSKVSNDELARRVKIFLSSRHQPSFRHLHIDASGGTVTLRGRVSSFYEKQLSYQCCRHVAGVFKIIDQVDVTTPKSEA